MKLAVRNNAILLLVVAFPVASFQWERSHNRINVVRSRRFLQEDNSTAAPEEDTTATPQDNTTSAPPDADGDSPPTEMTDDFRKCVDEVGGTSYSHLFEPCNITIYSVPSAADLDFDSVKNEAEQENVPGLIETCSVLSDEYKLETFSYDIYFIWKDPCVALDQRCYDLAALSPEQRKEVEDFISVVMPSKSQSLIGNTTHVSIDCTVDFEARKDFEENVEDLVKILGIGLVAFYVCCSVLCCVCCLVGGGLIFWCCARK